MSASVLVRGNHEVTATAGATQRDEDEHPD